MLMSGDTSLSDIADVAGSDSASEAVQALVVLGYSQSEAASAVAKCDKSLGTDEIIKKCLRLLASNRF